MDSAASNSGGGLVRSPSGTTLTLDSVVRHYDVLTISGATTITVTGTTLGATASMVVLPNGTNVPTISGADEWATSFGYLNTDRVPNRLDVWYDGVARRYAWSQQAVPAAVPVPDTTAPTFSSAVVANATPTKITITYSEALSSTLTGSITVGGVTRSVVSQTVVGSTVEVVVNTAYANGDTITVTVPSGCVKDAAGNAANALTAQSVTNNVAAPGEDAITTAYRAALATAGVTPNETHMGYVNTFAAGLRTAGLHTKITAINLACQDTLGGSLVSLIGTNATGVNNPTFDPNLGWSNATSTTYINTGVTPSTSPIGFGVYLRTSQTSDTTARVAIGTSSATDVYRICGNRNAAGSSSAGSVSGLTGGTANGAATTGGLVPAMWHVIRRGATDEVLLKNGASVGTNTTSTTQGAGTVPLYLYVQNATAGPTTTSVLSTGSRIAAYWIDDGTMTNTEAGTFYTLLQAFQTSMGRNV